MTTLSDAAELIRNARSIAIATHVMPDADAIGSLLGLGLALQALGKHVVLLCDNAVPRELRFLPNSDAVNDGVPEGFEADLFIGLDAGDMERLGDVSQPLLEGESPILNIDHHITNLDFGTVNLVDTESTATAEILLRLLDTLDVTLTPDIATCLMTGLVGDTRSFSTPNTSPEALMAGARLIEAGADVAFIAEAVLNQRTFNALRMWGIGLSNVHIDDGLIWTTITLSERHENGLPDITKTGLSNILISAEEANVAAVFTERVDGRVGLSMRARPGYDVATVALSLGGGGHQLAAGCTLDGPLEDAVNRVLPLLKEQIGQPANGRG